MGIAFEKREDNLRATALRRAAHLLFDALKIVDELRDFPEVGARLNDLIETLGNESGLSLLDDPTWTDNDPART